MTEVLFGPDPAEPVRATERGVLRLLDRRYSANSMGVDRFTRAHHVRSEASWAKRVCDFMAQDTYRVTDGDWHGPQYALHGHEVKVSRSDWLAELRDPEKAEAFRPYCTHWWLVVSDRAIVRDDLPDGWGLLVVEGSRLVARRKVPAVEPQPMPRPMLAGFLRAAHQLATRETREAAAS